MKYLYNAVLPEAAQPTERDRLGTQLVESGVLGEDSVDVESLSSEAADLRLEGQIRWGESLSSMIAHELEELADATLETVPLYRRGDGAYQNAGYYEIASADVEPLHGNQRDVWSWTLELTFGGNRATHFRAVETDPRQADHDWGNDTDTLIGAPASARKVRWMNPEDKSLALADPLETRAAANGDVDIYDVDAGETAVGSSTPTLIYEVGYETDVRAGTRIYDTRGYTGKFSDRGIRQWQTVHSTEHDIDDPVVMSNGLLRLRLDDRAGTIKPERWTDADGHWASDPLGDSSGWELFDVDVLEVGMAADRVQLTFAHSDQGLYALDAMLDRGREAVLFEIPENESGPIPTGLVDWLDPIAATTISDPQATKALVSRNNVRR